MPTRRVGCARYKNSNSGDVSPIRDTGSDRQMLFAQGSTRQAVDPLICPFTIPTVERWDICTVCRMITNSPSVLRRAGHIPGTEAPGDLQVNTRNECIGLEVPGSASH